MLKVVVRFKIMGEFHPDEITAVLGIKPSEVYRKGQPIPGTRLHYKLDGWILEDGVESDVNLDDKLAGLFHQLKPVLSKLEAMPPPIQKETSCIIYTSIPSPVVHFSDTVIQQIASITGCLEVGVCVLPEEGQKMMLQ